MYEFHPYFTNDGSVGLYSPEFDDIYHSSTGALTEAYEKFIMPVNMDELLKNNKDANLYLLTPIPRYDQSVNKINLSLAIDLI